MKKKLENRIIDNCILILLEYHFDVVKYHLSTVGSDESVWWIYFKDAEGREIRFEDVYVNDKGALLEYRIEIR